MATTVTYHAGGYRPSAPAQNRAEQQDNGPNTYTRWNTAGVQVEQRPLTTDEAAALAAQDTAQTASTNHVSLRDKASQALAANSTYLALVTPTVAQNTAQVQRLTRENNALIRLMIGALDTTVDT